MGKFFKAFKKFLLEGDALSMAVGVIIGAAMKDLVTSLVDNVFTPIIGLVLGQVDFSALSFVSICSKSFESAYSSMPAAVFGCVVV